MVHQVKSLENRVVPGQQVNVLPSCSQVEQLNRRYFRRRTHLIHRRIVLAGYDSQALDDGILNNLMDMIKYMKAGEFVEANNIYLLTAIGNAPWPIGLTMVGIHERSGTCSDTGRGAHDLLRAFLVRHGTPWVMLHRCYREV